MNSETVLRCRPANPALATGHSIIILPKKAAMKIEWLPLTLGASQPHLMRYDNSWPVRGRLEPGAGNSRCSGCTGDKQLRLFDLQASVYVIMCFNISCSSWAEEVST